MTTALGDLRARLDALTDRAALRDLVHGYGYVLGFDDRRADAERMRQVFTEDVSVEFPVGAHTRRAGLDGLHRDILGLWERSGPDPTPGHHAPFRLALPRIVPDGHDDLARGVAGVSR